MNKYIEKNLCVKLDNYQDKIYVVLFYSLCFPTSFGFNKPSAGSQKTMKYY